jgi:hypothetical protein
MSVDKRESRLILRLDQRRCRTVYELSSSEKVLTVLANTSKWLYMLGFQPWGVVVEAPRPRGRHRNHRG